MTENAFQFVLGGGEIGPPARRLEILNEECGSLQSHRLRLRRQIDDDHLGSFDSAGHPGSTGNTDIPSPAAFTRSRTSSESIVRGPSASGGSRAVARCRASSV